MPERQLIEIIPPQDHLGSTIALYREPNGALSIEETMWTGRTLEAIHLEIQQATLVAELINSGYAIQSRR